MMTRLELEASLEIEENIIPQGKKNRPGTLIVPHYITIHNTDNTKKGADARMHGKFLTNTGYYILDGKIHWVSWHYTVDDRRIVKHLPTNEKAFHAVNGNSQSIGIEVCMNQGIDQEKAFHNAARLAALLLFDLGSLKKEVNNVVPHKYWTGKDCPRLLLDYGNVLGKKWQSFLNTIQQELDSIQDDFHCESNAIEISSDLSYFVSNISKVQAPFDFHHDENDETIENNGLVTIEVELYTALAQLAQKRGINIETLVNLWLQQRLSKGYIPQ